MTENDIDSIIFTNTITSPFMMARRRCCLPDARFFRALFYRSIIILRRSPATAAQRHCSPRIICLHYCCLPLSICRRLRCPLSLRRFVFFMNSGMKSPPPRPLRFRGHALFLIDAAAFAFRHFAAASSSFDTPREVFAASYFAADA